MTKFKALVARFSNEESGASMIEYALLAALIAVAAVATIALVGTGVNNTFTTVKDKLP